MSALRALVVNDALGAELSWSSFVETHVFNSNKVFAVYQPA